MPDTETPDAPTPPAKDAPPEPTPPADDIDWKAEARKWEQRAKDNKTAADRLAELEEAQKSEVQKVQDKATAAERERDAAKAEALRYRVASKHGITDEDAELFLTGTDEETLTKQAQRLTERSPAPKKNHVPREGTTPRDPKDDEMRAFTRQLFKSAAET